MGFFAEDTYAVVELPAESLELVKLPEDAQWRVPESEEELRALYEEAFWIPAFDSKTLRDYRGFRIIDQRSPSQGRYLTLIAHIPAEGPVRVWGHVLNNW